MNSFGFHTLFFSAAAVSLLSVLIGLGVPETLKKHEHHSAAAAPAARTSDLLRVVRLPAMVMFTVTASYGAVQSFVPIYGPSEGVENPGIFFTVYAFGLMGTRLFAGKLSDKFGRRAVLLPGVALTAIAIGVLAISGTLPALIAAAVLLAVGLGSAQVGLMTLVVDSVSPQSRGAALGYFQACFEIGFGSGSVLGGVGAQSVGFHSMYLIGLFVPAAGFLAFILGERGHQRRVAAIFR
jgi:predicted MFS family arabinose efflux permease